MTTPRRSVDVIGLLRGSCSTERLRESVLSSGNTQGIWTQGNLLYQAFSKMQSDGTFGHLLDV
jgi:hypothetical protein